MSGALSATTCSMAAAISSRSSGNRAAAEDLVERQLRIEQHLPVLVDQPLEDLSPCCRSGGRGSPPRGRTAGRSGASRWRGSPAARTGTAPPSAPCGSRRRTCPPGSSRRAILCPPSRSQTERAFGIFLGDRRLARGGCQGGALTPRPPLHAHPPGEGEACQALPARGSGTGAPLSRWGGGRWERGRG